MIILTDIYATPKFEFDCDKMNEILKSLGCENRFNVGLVVTAFKIKELKTDVDVRSELVKRKIKLLNEIMRRNGFEFGYAQHLMPEQNMFLKFRND